VTLLGDGVEGQNMHFYWEKKPFQAQPFAFDKERTAIRRKMLLTRRSHEGIYL
jgi:hypothetical protein